METSMRTQGLMGTAVRTAAVLLLVWAGTAVAAEGEVVISGAQPSKRKVVSPAGGRASLFGPVKLTPRLKDATGIVYLLLEGVTFDPAGGNESQLFLVDAKDSAKELQIDPANYVGSAANVSGMPSKGLNLTLEINDFKADDKEFKARTHLKAMDQVFLALVVTRGKVSFRRALLTTEPPPAK
jgi:hypothetical protein